MRVMIAKRFNGVVPAKAGTHTPRPRCYGDCGPTAFVNNRRLWLMVWTAPYGISVPE